MSFITSCPHCETFFNITESQLQKTHGIVRCGFCLQTFSALEHQLYLDEQIDLDMIDMIDEGIIDDTELPAGEYESMLPKDTQQDSGAGQNPQIPTLEVANVILDEEEEAERLNDEDPSQEEPQASEDETRNSMDDIARDREDFDALGHEGFPINEEASEDDGLTDDLDDIDADETLYQNDSQAPTEIVLDSEPSDDIATSEAEDEDAETLLQDELQTIETVSLTKTMTPDIEGIEQPADQDNPLEDSFDATEDEFEPGLPESDSGEEYSLESTELPADPTAPSSAHSASAENSSASTPITRTAAKPELQILSSLYDESPLERLDESNLNSLSAEPIAIHQQAAGSRMLKRLLISLNVFLLLGLAAQATWKNIDSLLLDTRFSPISNLLCQVLACPAVAQFDLNKFSTEELFVNAHPQRENALQIDFIFRNNASYPQAFPLVELNFTDLNRRLLANRLFSPTEYLDPELQQFELLPAGASIQIQLEIADPGPEAINYSLALRHPGTP
jgi:predicted Zn finger-like uncharacterized protein